MDKIFAVCVIFAMLLYGRYKKSDNQVLKYITKVMAVVAIIVLATISILIVYAIHGYFMDKNKEATIKLVITAAVFIPSAILLTKNLIKDIKN
ncbi:MAG: hypothetical protein Q4D95_02785 [Peptoniphilus sp.]|nr:hypothetical protein [Peptoniphilus sp.]